MTSQIQVVLSRDLAREVIKKENLAANPEFDPAVSGTSLLRVLLGLFGIGRDPSSDVAGRAGRSTPITTGSTSIAIEKSRVIAVDFKSADPDLAARVANAVAETYLRCSRSAKQDQTRAAGDWLAGEIDKLRTKVADAEAKVEDYRAKTNLFSGSNNTSLPTQQLTEINSQIAAARGQKADLEARAKQLRELIRSGKPIESSDIANSDSMRRLVEQRNALRSQLAEQSTTLLDQHPRIKELKAQIAELDRQIRREGERLARSARQRRQGRRRPAGDAHREPRRGQEARLAEQRAGRAVARARARRQDRARSARSPISPNIARRPRATTSTPRRRRRASFRAPAPAIEPDYPKKLPTVLIAAFAAFALSAGFIVTGALLARRRRRPIGYAYAPAGITPQPAYGRRHGADAARCRRRRRCIATFGAASGGRALWRRMSPSEQIAQQLCARPATPDAASPWSAPCAMSAPPMPRFRSPARWREEANVVLVDLAFGAPNLSVISTDPKAPGIAELVRGTASFGDIITRRPIFAPCTSSRPAMSATMRPALAASPMLATVIEALVRSYDHVVIDVGSAADIAVERFAPLAPRAVLVAADPANPATKAARERLMMAGFADVTLMAGAPQEIAA